MMIMATTTIALAQVADRAFESEEGTYRLQVPQGQAIQDLSGEEGYTETIESTGVSNAALLCKENETLPGIGGTYDCINAQTTASDAVTIYPDLQDRPEFERLLEEENKTITTTDLVALFINDTQRFIGAYDFVIQDSVDLDESRKIIQAQYHVIDQAGTPLQPFDDFSIPGGTSGMFVLSEDRDTGYVISGPPIYNPTTGARTEDCSSNGTTIQLI